jgi:hypothetical protein
MFLKKVPKSGFINVLDYDSPKKLAEYLLYLDGNKTAYNAYFKWKKNIWFHHLKAQYCTICSMCIKLHLEEYTGVKENVVSDVRTIWDRNKHCRLPKMERKGDVMYYSA